MGKVPVGMEWLLDNISTTDELRPHLKMHSLARGYLKALEQICDNHAPLLHKHARVICADINGPTDRCLFLVLASYPMLSNDDRPMMQGYNGNFLYPTIAALIQPWANILQEQFKIRYVDASYQLVNIGLEDIKDISGVMDVSGGVVFIEMDAQEKEERSQKEGENRKMILLECARK